MTNWWQTIVHDDQNYNFEHVPALENYLADAAPSQVPQKQKCILKPIGTHPRHKPSRQSIPKPTPIPTLTPNLNSNSNPEFQTPKWEWRWAFTPQALFLTRAPLLRQIPSRIRNQIAGTWRKEWRVFVYAKDNVETKTRALLRHLALLACTPKQRHRDSTQAPQAKSHLIRERW